MIYKRNNCEQLNKPFSKSIGLAFGFMDLSLVSLLKENPFLSIVDNFDVQRKDNL